MRANLANGKAPDWIDYRASVSRALRRRDAGETVRTCAGCRTELDVDEARHSPRCTGEETAPPATAQAAETTPPPAAPAPAADRRRGRGVARWNRGSVEEAIRAWAAAHDGRPPIQRNSTGDPLLPSLTSTRETHGSWANAVEASGFPRPTRGSGKSAPTFRRFPR